MSEFKEGDKVWLTFKGVILGKPDTEGHYETFLPGEGIDSGQIRYINPDHVRIKMREED